MVVFLVSEAQTARILTGILWVRGEFPLSLYSTSGSRVWNCLYLFYAVIVFSFGVQGSAGPLVGRAMGQGNIALAR